MQMSAFSLGERRGRAGTTRGDQASAMWLCLNKRLRERGQRQWKALRGSKPPICTQENRIQMSLYNTNTHRIHTLTLPNTSTTYPVDRPLCGAGIHEVRLHPEANCLVFALGRDSWETDYLCHFKRARRQCEVLTRSKSSTAAEEQSATVLQHKRAAVFVLTRSSARLCVQSAQSVIHKQNKSALKSASEPRSASK